MFRFAVGKRHKVPRFRRSHVMSKRQAIGSSFRYVDIYFRHSDAISIPRIVPELRS